MRSPHTDFHNTPKQLRGVGLIEVLVTLFVLAIGLLGVASLQFIGSLTNADALNRSQAVMTAQQLAERLRAASVLATNGDGLVVDNAYFDNDLYNFNNLACAGGGTPYQCFCLELPPAITDCQNNLCNQTQLAAFDAYEVSCAAVSANPAVSISLTCEDNNAADVNSCSAGSKHLIRLDWPTQNWQNIERELNPICNQDADEPMDCVVLDITL